MSKLRHFVRKKPKKFKPKDQFYRSKEWKELRLEILQESDGTCAICGKKKGNKLESGERIHLTVDHILPKSEFPELKLYKNNLQVLCQECNKGKDSSYKEEDLKILNEFLKKEKNNL